METPEASPETATRAQQPATELAEPRRVRIRRKGHRAGLYAWAFVLIGLLVVVIALAVANTRRVQLSWVVGTTRASLVWIILAAAVLGWLVGIATGIVFRLRTRRRHVAQPPPLP